MTARKDVANRSFVALHDLHEIGILVEDAKHWHHRVISDFHKSDLSIDLIEGEQVISIERKKEIRFSADIRKNWSVAPYYLPANFKHLDLSFLRPKVLKMFFFKLGVLFYQSRSLSLALLGAQLVRV